VTEPYQCSFELKPGRWIWAQRIRDRAVRRDGQLPRRMKAKPGGDQKSKGQAPTRAISQKRVVSQFEFHLSAVPGESLLEPSSGLYWQDIRTSCRKKGSGRVICRTPASVFRALGWDLKE
jgi:hypothetical protein